MRFMNNVLLVNHSCEPNLAFDLSSELSNDWCIRAERDIRAGEPRGSHLSLLLVS